MHDHLAQRGDRRGGLVTFSEENETVGAVTSVKDAGADYNAVRAGKLSQVLLLEATGKPREVDVSRLRLRLIRNDNRKIGIAQIRRNGVAEAHHGLL